MASWAQGFRGWSGPWVSQESSQWRSWPWKKGKEKQDEPLSFFRGSSGHRGQDSQKGMILSEKNVCSCWGLRDKTVETEDGGRLVEALRLLLCVVDRGATDVFWTEVWRMQWGVLNIVLKMDHKRRNWSPRTLYRSWWGSGPTVAVMVHKILEEETQKSLEMDWFSMCLCVHTSIGMEDDLKVWGLCDHLDEVILWEKVLFGFWWC